jgi:hypothetical protein
MPEVFTQSQLQAIADALGDTSEGLSGSEIKHLLETCRMGDPSSVDDQAPSTLQRI